MSDPQPKSFRAQRKRRIHRRNPAWGTRHGGVATGRCPPGEGTAPATGKQKAGAGVAHTHKRPLAHAPRRGTHQGGVDTPRCRECLLPFWLSSCGPWGLVRFAAHQRWLMSCGWCVGVCRERAVASGLVWSVRATGLVTGLGRDVGGGLLIPVLQRRLPPGGPWGLGRLSTDPQACFKEMRLAGGGSVSSRRGRKRGVSTAGDRVGNSAPGPVGASVRTRWGGGRLGFGFACSVVALLALPLALPAPARVIALRPVGPWSIPRQACVGWWVTGGV